MNINSNEQKISQKRMVPSESEGKQELTTKMETEPGKSCSKKKKVEEDDEIEIMTEKLHELLGNPVLVMGLFDVFFEHAPEDISINYKGLNIQIQTTLDHDPEGINLLKYLGNKFI